MILLYSLKTKTIKFTIGAPDDTFDITPVTYGCRYHLLADDVPIADYKCPFIAIDRVAEHQTGLQRWDTSRVKASPESKDWECHFDDLLRFKVVGEYVAKRSRLSYREIDQYFRHKHPYLMDRLKLRSILEDLAVSGQLDKPISADQAPNEFGRVSKQIERWRNTGDA